MTLGSPFRTLGRLEAVALAVLVLVLDLAIVAGAGALVTGLRLGSPLGFLVRHLVHLGAVLGLLLLMVRWRRLDRADLGLVATPPGRLAREALVGVLGGTLLALACFAVALAAGAYRVTVAPAALHPGPGELTAAFASMALAALFEELAFRAGLVGPLARAWPRSVAVIAPALPFAVLHAVNPGASLAGIIGVALAGLLLGLLFLDPGQARVPALGLCTGVHLGWNFTVGRLGIPVSGHAPSTRWLEVQPQDQLFSGGAFGIEAGLGTLLVLAVAVGVLAGRARARMGR